MRTRFVIFGFGLALVSFGILDLLQPVARGQDEDVRGAFLTTRPRPVEKTGSMGATTSSKPSRKRPKTSDKKQSGGTPSDSGKKENATTAPKVRAQKIGLGLTLFERNANGLAVRVDPNRVFRSGDRVRVLLETNVDGYLYIFNTTDGGKPVMIYPSAELDEGGNYIQSHIPFEIPSSVADQERLRWLTFDKYSGAERLYFVFTREPLPAVPTEDDLLNFCREKESNCPIQPSADMWSKIQSESSTQLQVARSQEYGKAQTSGEVEASTRGLGLSKDDPEPSLVMMTASANTGILVAVLELIHK